MLAIDTKAPEFTAHDQDDKERSLKEFVGHFVVLYFYPKDDTPGCTTEACSIRDSYSLLEKRAVVIGVSSDSVESHKKFAEKYNLPFTLLSDPEKNIIRAYEADGVFTKRITYLIDPKGMILKTYPQVNPSQHAAGIVTDLENLQK